MLTILMTHFILGILSFDRILTIAISGYIQTKVKRMHIFFFMC